MTQVRITKMSSEDEYEEAVHAIFKEVDANGDGVLQIEEFKPFMIRIS